MPTANKSRNQTKRILFLGTHGQYNIGDELLLETFLSQLGTKYHYCVNSYDPAYTLNQLRGEYDVETFHTRGELPKLLLLLFRCDLLFFGGGSIIKELYESVGRNRYATLGMVLLIVLFACWIARKPVIMSNIGVGPLETPLGMRLARWILKPVSLVAVRDLKSYETCQKLGIHSDRLHLVPDAVFVRNPESMLPPSIHTTEATGVVRMALNLNYDIENPTAWESFIANLAEALRQFGTQHQLQLHTLPMQSRYKAHSDYEELSKLCQMLPGIEMQMHQPENAREVAQIIASCDLVVAERYHALVIAAILGKPCFALIYDMKVSELVKSLGIQTYAIDINKPFSADDLLQGWAKLLVHREEAHAHLVQRSEVLHAESQAYFDTLREKLPC